MASPFMNSTSPRAGPASAGHEGTPAGGAASPTLSARQHSKVEGGGRFPHVNRLRKSGSVPNVSMPIREPSGKWIILLHSCFASPAKHCSATVYRCEGWRAISDALSTLLCCTDGALLNTLNPCDHTMMACKRMTWHCELLWPCTMSELRTVLAYD